MKKILNLTLCLLITAISISGCSSRTIDKNTKQIRVAYWGSPEEVKIIKNVINKWQEQHPNIKVRLDHTNYSGYSSKILTQIAGGTAPDIICTEVDMFVNFVKKGVLYPLNEFLKKDSDFNIKDFFPQVIDRFTVNKNLYCLPRDTAPFACVYYNKNLFDIAGISYPNDNWDWNDLLDKAKKLTVFDKKGNTIQYGFYSWAWQNFIYSNGGSLVNNVKNPTKCLLDKPSAINGLQFYSDLINKHKVMPAPIAMTNLGMGIKAMFVSRKIAMFNSGIWETPSLREKTKTMKQKGEIFDWDVAMFPKNPNGKRGFGTGGSGYAITAKCRNKDAAWEVIKALTGEEGQINLSNTGLTQPANKKIAESKYWALNNDMPLNKKMLNNAVKYVTYNPFHAKWAEIQQKFITPKLELVFNGKISAKKAVKLFINKVNKILEEPELK